MAALLYVCLGSAIGGGARFLLTQWVLARAGAAFPFGTLLVNLLGSFSLAAIAFTAMDHGPLAPNLRLALTTGLLGGFTTFSTFSFETMRLLQSGEQLRALSYVCASLFGGLAAAFLGWASARWLLAS